MSNERFYLAYEFTKCIIQKPVTVVCTTATSVFTSNAHGLANGDALALTEITGLSGVALATTYFVVGAAENTFGISATIGGSAIAVGTGAPTVLALKEYSFPWPNTSSFSPENKEYTWEGGAETRKNTLLSGLVITFESAAVPSAVHAALFEKPAVTVAVPGGMTNLTGYGGGDDVAGIACGLRLEGFATRFALGIETRVDYAQWFPSGTLTLTGPGALQTGQASGTTSYSFTVSRTTTTAVGGLISSEAQFFYDGEI